MTQRVFLSVLTFNLFIVMNLIQILTEIYRDPEVIKIQTALKNTNKYDLGKSGPAKDGVDGVYGKLTDIAYRKEYGKPFKTTNTNANTKNRGRFIISEPNNATDKTVAVVFGGISYATPAWMKSQVPKELLNKKTFVFAPHTSSIDEVQKAIGNKKITSVMGFSAGGHKVWPLAGQYNFVGLIDPSTKISYIDAYPINNKSVVMMFNNSNWTNGYPHIAEAQKSAAKLMGSNAIKTSSGHASIPAEFFGKFINKI
jgi:hypothetical protein